MQGELYLESLKLEGNLFKLGKLKDRATNLNEYIKLDKEIYQTTVKLEQYRLCIEQNAKDEALKKLKRKMMRGQNE